MWFHGDMAVNNLLVHEGRLVGVIDFGCCGVGDPACDLVLAWTLFSGESRAVFRAGLAADTRLWARARGWAVWSVEGAAGDPGGSPGRPGRLRATGANRLPERTLCTGPQGGLEILDAFLP